MKRRRVQFRQLDRQPSPTQQQGEDSSPITSFRTPSRRVEIRHIEPLTASDALGLFKGAWSKPALPPPPRGAKARCLFTLLPPTRAEVIHDLAVPCRSVLDTLPEWDDPEDDTQHDPFEHNVPTQKDAGEILKLVLPRQPGMHPLATIVSDPPLPMASTAILATHANASAAKSQIAHLARTVLVVDAAGRGIALL